jgi:Tol biopolymer transport system component
MSAEQLSLIRMCAATGVVAILTSAFAATACGEGRTLSGSEIGSARRSASGAIVFARHSRSRPPAIYRADVATGNIHLLIANAEDPAVSANGRWIAFTRRGGIWTADATGKNPRRLTNSGRDLDPAWGKDDRTLFFARGRPTGSAALFWTRLDRARPAQLTHPPPSTTSQVECHVAPAPSPNGRLVAYDDYPDCVRGGAVFISAVRTNGKPAQLLSKFRGRAQYRSELSWSPSGRLVAFAAFDLDQEVNNGLFVSEPDGTHARRIWRGVPAATAWSPDGASLVFVGDSDLWVTSRDGRGSRRLTKTGASVGLDSPSWLR